MARISQYGQDSTLNKADKVIGTDSATGGTKNYTIESILDLLNEENLVESFDGAAFEFQNYVDPADDPEGVINLNAGTATGAYFSAINTLYISIKDKSGSSLAEYLENADNDFIKISKTDNLNQFGIYEVTAIEDYGDAKYKKLTLTPRGTNGTLTVGTKYFVANYSALYDQDFSDDSITEFGDVSNSFFTGTGISELSSAGSGAIITTAERTSLNNFTDNGLLHADVIDALTSTATDVPLSANQGRVLNGFINTINTLLDSDNASLDDLQEIVDFIEANRATLDALAISSIPGLQAALDAKEDSVSGKGLSTNDFTADLLQKLNDIQELAQVNVQSDWSAVSGDALINNKPTDLTNLSLHNVTDLSDITSAGSGQIITGDERIRLGGIAAGAEVNVQSDWNATSGDALILNKPTLAASDAEANVQADWNESDTSSDAHILNKPSVALSTTTIQAIGTANEIEVAPTTAQDLSADRTITIGLPNDVVVTGDLSANDVKPTETIEFTDVVSTAPTFDNGIYYNTENGYDTLHFRYHGNDLSIDKITEILPSGILNGGELSKENTTQFTIQAGDGIINDLNKAAGSDPHPEIVSIEWSTQTIDVTMVTPNVTEQLNSWIYIDNAGVVQQQETAFTEAQFRTSIPIGAAIYANGVLQFTRTFPRTAYNQMSQHSEFIASFGPLKKSGHKVSASGSNLSINRSAGVAFALGRNYATDPENPSTVSDGAKSTALIHRYRADGSNGFVKDTNSGAGYTVLDPAKYDDGDGTLANVSGGHYSVQRLFYFPGSSDIVVAYYGTAEYNSMDTAEKGYLLETFTEADNTAQQAIYLGAVIVQGSATDLSSASQAKFLTAGTFRSLAATNLGGVAANATLSDLGDVTVTGPSNGQVLKYDSSQQLWINDTDAGGIQLTDLSVGAEASASGDGDIDYDNTTGVFTYTPPDLSSYLTAAIDGSGTAGVLPKMSDSDTITDSVISESGQVVNIDTTGAIRIPDGDTNDRPTGVNGMFRYNTDDNQFEGYTAGAWGAIAGSGGSGGTIVKKTFSGNGSNRDFLLDDVIVAKSNVDVYVNGVYQFPSNYEVSGSTVTFDTDAIPSTGTDNISITNVIGVISTEGSSMQKTSFTGNGLTTTFALSDTPQAKSFTIVHVQGIYQESSTYDISGSNIVFDTAPSNGHTVEVTFIAGTISVASLDIGSQTINSFTGTGSATSFDLSTNAVADKNYTDVYINGVYQAKDQYELSGTNIVFDTAPQNGYSVEVKCHSASPNNVVPTSTMTSDVFTADGTTSTFPLVNGSPVSKEFTMVFVSGIYQQKSAYNLSGSNIVFDGENPAEDDTIEVITLSSLNNTSSPVSSVNGQTGAVLAVSSVNGQTGVVSITSDVTSVQSKTGAVTLVSADIPGVVDTSDDTTGLTFWTGTQAEYDALSTYDSNKLYFIT